MDRQRLDALWFSGEAIPGVDFKLNDAVIVARGEYTGRAAAVISVEESGPEPLHIVEIGGSGQDARLRESDLRAA